MIEWAMSYPLFAAALAFVALLAVVSIVSLLVSPFTKAAETRRLHAEARLLDSKRGHPLDD